jgi:hypothetical protein
MDQPPQQPQYPQYPDRSQYGTQFPAQKTNGMAIASLISGILGLTMCAGIGSVFALIFGYVGRGQIKRSQGTEGGGGMAMTGIVLGWIGLVLTVLLFVLLIGGAITFFSWTQSDGFGDAVEDGVGFIAGESLDEIGPAEAGCTPVEKFKSQGADHISEGSTFDYNSSPPTSGPHYEVPAETGFYPADSDIEPERLVHNLEHGQIVVWYRPDVEDLGFLEKQIETLVEQEPMATVGAPYAEMDGRANIVISAWRHSQACVNASQEVVDDFRREFQGKGPEPLTPAFKG